MKERDRRGGSKRNDDSARHALGVFQTQNHDSQGTDRNNCGLPGNRVRGVREGLHAVKKITWNMIHAQAEEVANLRAGDEDGDSVGEADNYGTGEIFDGGAHARDPKHHEEHASHDGACEKAIDAILRDDAGDHHHESTGRAADLRLGASQRGNNEPGDDRAVNAGLRRYPGGNRKRHRQRQGNQPDGYASKEVGNKFVAVIVAQQDYGFGQPGIQRGGHTFNRRTDSDRLSASLTAKQWTPCALRDALCCEMNPRNVWQTASSRRNYRSGLQVFALFVFGRVRLGFRARGIPAQNRLARGADFIEPADSSGMRRGFHQIWIGRRFFRNRPHGIYKKIALFFGFRFRRLDHQCPGNNQRKCRRIRMESVVDQSLGDVHGADAILFLVCVAEYHFVHGGQGIRQIVNAFQMLADVVGVEHRVLRGLPDAGTIRQNVGERAHQHSEISGERFYATDGIRPHRFEAKPAAFLFHKDWNRAKRLQDFLHGHRARARTASAVRSRECLMQIQVHHVHAEIARPRDSRESVHVRAVHIQQRALGVQDLRDFRDALLKNAQRRRIRDHQRSDIRRDQFTKLVDVDLAVRFGFNVFHFIARDNRGGRIRAVRGIRNQNFLTWIALLLQIRANQQQAGKFALSAGGGL